MKKILSIATALILTMCMTVALNAQSDGGTIVLEITDVTSENAQIAGQLEMLKGGKTTVFYKDKVSLTKVDLMGGMIKMDVKQDADENSDMLFDMFGNKIWVASTKLERLRQEAESDNPMSEMDITYDRDDKKTVAGFECFKMIVEFPDAEGNKLEAYVTDQIDVRPSFVQGVSFEDFEGLPLEVVFSNPQMTMTTKAISYEDKVDESIFDLNTSGYQKMTMQEFGEMMQQMGGGGFGF